MTNIGPEEGEEALAAQERDEVLGEEQRDPKGVVTEEVTDQLDEIDPGRVDPR